MKIRSVAGLLGVFLLMAFSYGPTGPETGDDPETDPPGDLNGPDTLQALQSGLFIAVDYAECVASEEKAKHLGCGWFGTEQEEEERPAPFFQFGWDDGSVSEWAGAEQAHDWGGAGACSVRVRMRCGGNISGWSAPHLVTIIKPGLEVTPEDQGVPQTPAASATFTVRNDGDGSMSWSATHYSLWVKSLSPSEGTLGAGKSTTLTATYAENEGGTPRICMITVTAAGAHGSPKTVSLTQGGPTPILTAAPDAQQVPATPAGSTTFTLANSGFGSLSWSAAAGTAWVTLWPASGTLEAGESATLTANYAENSGSAARTCPITVTAAGAQGSPKTVTVTQAPCAIPVLVVVPDSRAVEAAAGSTAFTLTNSGCGSMSWSAAESCTWLLLSPANGILAEGASATLTASYTANPGCAGRSCAITVTAAGAQGSPKTVTVTQAADAPPILDVAPDNREVPATPAGSATFTLANSGCGSMSWSAAAGTAWVTLSPTSGVVEAGESATLTANYAENTGNAARTCPITVTAAGAQGSPRTVTVTQAPPCFLTVTDPTDAEVTWQEATPQTITWTHSDCGSTVRIELLRDGAPCLTIADSTPNDGSSTWIAQRCDAWTTGYRIRVVDLASGSHDESDLPFTIVSGCEVSLTSPNAGDAWRDDTEALITWTSSACGADVRIELLRTGSPCLTIADSTPNDGSFAWLPARCEDASTGYRIRVTDTASDQHGDSEEFSILETAEVQIRLHRTASGYVLDPVSNYPDALTMSTQRVTGDVPPWNDCPLPAGWLTSRFDPRADTAAWLRIASTICGSGLRVDAANQALAVTVTGNSRGDDEDDADERKLEICWDGGCALLQGELDCHDYHRVASGQSGDLCKELMLRVPAGHADVAVKEITILFPGWRVPVDLRNRQPVLVPLFSVAED